jgi:predicted MFS family arabinose efflux permease
VCFLANGVSYLAVLAALLAMRLEPRPPRPGGARLLHGLREGFRYAWGFPPIRAVLLLLALVSMGGTSYSVLLPALTVDVLQGGPGTLAWLTAASGVGALAGALFLGMRRSVLGLGKWISLSPALLGAGLLALTAVDHLLPALGLLVLCGFAMIVQMAASNTVL